MINHTKAEATQAIKILKPFMCQSQISAIGSACYGKEKQFFFNKLVEMADLIASMPETYGQDGVKDPVAYLHYFLGGSDFYITEKDNNFDGAGQVQAFGLANLGYGGELGYISISELIANNIELDLYFEPTTLTNLN